MFAAITRRAMYADKVVLSLIGWRDGADEGCPIRPRGGGEGAVRSWSRSEHSGQGKLSDHPTSARRAINEAITESSHNSLQNIVAVALT